MSDFEIQKSNAIPPAIILSLQETEVTNESLKSAWKPVVNADGEHIIRNGYELYEMPNGDKKYVEVIEGKEGRVAGNMLSEDTFEMAIRHGKKLKSEKAGVGD